MKSPPIRDHYRGGVKPGATREQIKRRERFERAHRKHLRSENTVVLYGWHSVTAALKNPNRLIRKLLATENAARRLSEENIALPTMPDIVRPSVIAERLLPDAVHQGLYLETEPLSAPNIEDLPYQSVLLVLDHITDPHNVGAIFRSAAAFNVTAIMTTHRHSPETTGALAKAASGALEYVPLITIQNLARGLITLKSQDFLVVGLDSTGKKDLANLPLRRPLALVLGAEGKGLRDLTKAACDHLARIDLPGGIKSLNVSNAAALALYITNRALT
jgi:23S rRNA (guanosine2251-2'-O)-methyltransferase